VILVNINGVEVSMPANARVDWDTLPKERLTGDRLRLMDQGSVRPLHWSGAIEIDATR
jgi:hypothetical protein